MILFEMEIASREQALEALKLAAYKLPVRCKVVER
jgi:ribosomal protein L16/L10AE